LTGKRDGVLQMLFHEHFRPWHWTAIEIVAGRGLPIGNTAAPMAWADGSNSRKRIPEQLNFARPKSVGLIGARAASAES
jgi:hypothetical protein